MEKLGMRAWHQQAKATITALILSVTWLILMFSLTLTKVQMDIEE